MKTTDPPIITEQEFNKSIDEVWNAITDVEQMREWFFENIPAFEPVVGFETLFDVKSEVRTFPHAWKVTAVSPQKSITVNWKFNGYQGDSNVTFDLSEISGKTKITVTAKVTEDFDETIPEFKRESAVEGWKYFINNRLKIYLDEL
ncbi:MAG: SRPBCC domain-containing protein [Bacteroidia bacterium]|nr:SRPBCC domain-containing protein [Bacteroidia bacterium]NNC85507.1 SRPBCC domain-containing protein [Bacteroidia bacterium]NNM16508.1 SRPBCC domain-containing protein [Bacteroidia bacterium]